MEYRALLLEKEGHIGIVTLNRPEVGNALSDQMNEEIDTVLRELDRDHDIRAVIITGAGRHFCTGVDLTMFAGPDRQSESHTEAPATASRPAEEGTKETAWGQGTVVGAVVMMRTMGKPVICAVNGPVAGAGLSLALAADIRIASDKARFSTVFVKRGLALDTGGSFTLPHTVGLPRACELAFTGDSIDAAEADRIGLVNRVVPHDELMTAAKALAKRIATNPPLAVSMTKASLYQGTAETNIIEQMNREMDIQGRLLLTEDFQEAATAFLEKREPRFKGK